MSLSHTPTPLNPSATFCRIGDSSASAAAALASWLRQGRRILRRPKEHAARCATRRGSSPAQSCRGRVARLVDGSSSSPDPRPRRGRVQGGTSSLAGRPVRGRDQAGTSSSPGPRLRRGVVIAGPSASRDRPPSRAVVIAGPSSSLGDHNKVRLGFLWC